MQEVSVITQARSLIESLGTGHPVVSTEVVHEIPFFGKVIKQVRDVHGTPTEYFNILRQFGWAVTFGVTDSLMVPTLIQWKPGHNHGGWELPPGGIGKIAEDAPLELILEKTQTAYQKETGYGEGTWEYLGHVIIETGKYRGATPNSRGLLAHLFIAKNLHKIQEPKHASNEIIHPLEVPLSDFRQVLESGLFTEESVVPCSYKALIRLGKLHWT